MVAVASRKSFAKEEVFPVFSEVSFRLSEDNGSLAWPPIHLVDRFRGRHSTTPEGESVNSQFSESDDSDGVDSDDGSGL